ncbi:hypothetical protein KUTeg_005652 [Tegillarca granosa]|uniref:Uncharacterized protein n=1 Tax=Tegillarca granosa TaxID=220873 RepID=A0ABQ9FKC1_TEGGR|nr:hypothetical protein KUTeg_004988 [Tegillarca granosa]KAJ8317748.1 hypothetical protein KUTeg_005652 [Tegillarca granosa]
MALIQDELDDIAEIWNTHTIRPSTNKNVPSGRPDLMYFTPMLWGSEDYLCSVPDEELDVCATEAEFRSSIPCDADVYKFCIETIRRHNLDIPKDLNSAVNVYKFLRTEILTVLSG